MTLSVLEGDYHVTGSFSVAGGASLAAGSVTNAMVKALAGLDVSKMDHRFTKVYTQKVGDYAYDEYKVIHIAKAAGTISRMVAFVDGAAVTSTLSIDLFKADGATGAYASIMTPYTTALAALTATELIGSVTTVAYAANAVFAIKIDVSALGGTLPTGLVVQVTFDEEAQ